MFVTSQKKHGHLFSNDFFRSDEYTLFSSLLKKYSSLLSGKILEVMSIASFHHFVQRLPGPICHFWGGFQQWLQVMNIPPYSSLIACLVTWFSSSTHFGNFKLEKEGGSDEYTPIFVTSARFHKQWKKWWISLLSIILIIRRLSQTMEEVMDLLVFHQSDHYGGSPLPDRTGLPKNRQTWLSQSINGKTRQSF